MRAAETQAKTRPEAIQKALDELGIDMSEAINIEILDEGSRGIFGLGARDVRVRVTAEDLPESARPRRSERTERPPREEKRPQQAERRPRPEKPTAQERPPRKERPAPQERPARAETKPAPRERPPKEERPDLPPISDSRRQEAAALLGEILAKMGFEVTVTSEATEEGGARINVASQDSALLIGRKGKNLESLQYLLNRMMSQGELAETQERITVDVENYLDRRRTSLEEMAHQLARKAKETGRDVRVKPMTAPERRIIHVTLQDDPDVRTFSLGEGSLRNVVISPKVQSTEPRRAKQGRGGPRRQDGRSQDGRGGRGPQRRRRGGGGRSRRERPASEASAENVPTENAPGENAPAENVPGDAQES